MANPIDTLRKLKGRSLHEIRVRSEQAISARTEQIGLSGKLPTNEEFSTLIDKSFFESENPIPENLRAVFYEQTRNSFFQSFNNPEKTLEIFRQKFGASVENAIIERANRIIEGKFDLLGYQNLDFGEHVDWHFEPVANKHVPLRHWKQFDELSTFETGDKKIIWELNRHQHFFTLGQAYWFTGDERFAKTFALQLDEWIMQNPPGLGINWSSSLEVAFRAMSWLWAFQFFKNSASFTPELFHNALRYLYLHGRHIEKYLSTYFSPNTHLTGEALGLFYIGSQLKFFTRSEHWQKLSEEILLAELDRQILPDGVYFEQSSWYQRYTADFYTHFLILKSLDKSAEIDQSKNEKLASKLQHQFDFLMHITRPDGTTPLIGDDDGGRNLPLSESEPNDFRYVLANGAVLFGRADYKFVAKNFAEETLWLLGESGATAFENLESHRPEQASRGFTAGGYFVMRDGWSDTDNFLLIDGGNLGALSAGHSHADTLMIDAAIAGKTLLTDAGTYTYHESENLRDYFRSTIAHNTLSVENESSSEMGGKFSWTTKAEARVHSWISENRFDFFEASHKGYERLPEAAVTHHRSVLFLKNDYWVLRDFAETQGEHSYQQNFHFATDAKPEIVENENSIPCVSETPKSQTGYRLFTFGDMGGWQRKEGWLATNYGKRRRTPFLRYVSRGIGSQEFFTFMFPADPIFEAPEVVETEVSGGRAFVINYRNYQDILVYSDGEALVKTDFFDTNFRFLWARLSPNENVPDEYVLVSGTKFILKGREIINHPHPLKFVTARRLGQRLNLHTSENIFSVQLAEKQTSRKLILTDLYED